MAREFEFGIRITGNGTVLVSEAGKSSQALAGIGQSAEAVNRQAAAATQSLIRMGQAAVTAISVREVTQAADAYANLNARLSLVSAGAASTAVAYQRVFEIAQATRQGVEEVALVYERFGRQADALGLSQTRLAAITETVSQAMVISGSSAESSRAALVQLGQGIASGTLRGEELNSVMEQAPRLAQALADGLGVPIGKLREMGEQGQLTAEKLVSALEGQGDRIAGEFARMPVTVGGALTNLRNAWVNTVGSFEQSSGVFRGTAGGLQTVAENMGSVATVGGAVAAVLGGRVVSSLVAATVGKVAAARAARELVLAHLEEATAAQAAAAAQVRAAGAYGAGLAATKALADANAALAAAQTAAAATGPLAAGLRFLGGPIGIVTSLVMAGATAWTLWGDSAKAAADKARDALRQVQERAAREGRKDTDIARENLAFAAERYYENPNDRALREKWAEADAVLKELETRDKNLAAQMKVSAATSSDAWAKAHLSVAEKRRADIADLDRLYASESAKFAGNAEKQLQLAREYSAKLAQINSKGNGGQRAAQEAKDFQDAAVVQAKAYADLYVAGLKYAQGVDQQLVAGRKLTEGEKILATAKQKLTADQYAEVEAVAAWAVEAERAMAIDQAWEKNAQDRLKTLDEQLERLEKEVKYYGLSESAIQDKIIAELEEQRAREVSIGLEDRFIQKLDLEIARRKQIAAAARSKEGLDANKAAAEDLARNMDRAAQDINRSLADAIMRGGKSAGEYLKDYFRSLVLTPMIQGVMQPVSNAVAGMFYGGGGAAGTATGGKNLLSTGSNAYSLYSGGASMAGMVTGVGNLVGSSSISAFGTGMAAGGADLSAAIAAYNAAGETAVASSLAAGQAAASWIPYVGWVIAAVALLSSLLEDGGGPKTEGGWSYRIDDQGSIIDNGTADMYGDGRANNRGHGANAAIADSLEGVVSGAQGFLGSLGSNANGLAFNLQFNSDPQGTAPDMVASSIRDKDGNVVYSHANNDLPRGSYKEELTNEVKRMMIGAVRAADVDPVFKALANSIDLATASAAQLDQKLADISNMDAVLDFGTRDPFQEFSEAAAAASLTTMEALARQKIAVLDAARAYDGSSASITKLASLTQQRYQLELRLAQELEASARQTAEAFASSTRTIRLSGLSNAEKYDFYDAESRRLRDQLAAVEDVASLNDIVGKLDRSMMEAWGSLDESQQRAQRQAFLDRYAELDSIAAERRADIQQQVREDNAQLKTDIRTAIEEAMATAAERIGDAVPDQVQVNVSVTLPPGWMPGSEVNGWGAAG